jgi:hypothetical protein
MRTKSALLLSLLLAGAFAASAEAQGFAGTDAYGAGDYAARTFDDQNAGRQITLVFDLQRADTGKQHRARRGGDYEDGPEVLNGQIDLDGYGGGAGAGVADYGGGYGGGGFYFRGGMAGPALGREGQLRALAVARRAAFIRGATGGVGFHGDFGRGFGGFGGGFGRGFGVGGGFGGGFGGVGGGFGFGGFGGGFAGASASALASASAGGSFGGGFGGR